jgi:hypothetical protein
VEREDLAERTPAFLGEIDELPEPGQKSGSTEADAARAVQALVEARDRAKVGQLLKIRANENTGVDSGDASDFEEEGVGTIDEFSFDSSGGEKDSESSFSELPVLADLEIDSFGPMQKRVDRFAELAHRELREARVSITDIDGVYLYRDEPFDMSVGQELRLIRSVQEAESRSGLKKVSGSQILGRNGKWHTVFPAHGDSPRLLAHFELEDPLDPSQLLAWSKVLAEAVDPANAQV